MVPDDKEGEERLPVRLNTRDCVDAEDVFVGDLLETAMTGFREDCNTSASSSTDTMGRWICAQMPPNECMLLSLRRRRRRCVSGVVNRIL